MAPIYEVPSKIEAVEIKGIGSVANLYHQSGLLELTAQNVGQDSTVDLRNCWILTAIAGSILFARYAAKVWEYMNRPKTTPDEGLWGLEDLLFFLSFGFHMTDMMFLQINQNMAHSFPQEYDATNWQFMSQPLATAAATLARSGMIWYLCQSIALGEYGKKIRPWLITLMSIHFAFNIVPCLYDMLQCDPSAFQSAGKTEYFQYMWSPSSHASPVCVDSRLQLAFAVAQGVVNMSTDLIIVFLTGLEVWSLLFPSQTPSLDNSIETVVCFTPYSDYKDPSLWENRS